MRGLAVLCTCASLAGCAGDQGLAGLELFGAGQSEGVTSLSLRSGSVQAGAPRGYCADRSVSRPRDGFAVFASCRRVTGSGSVPSVDGLVTVQVGAPGTAAVAGSEETLAAVLESDRGRALLAAGEDPGSVDVAVVEAGTGVVAVRFRDETSAGPEGLRPVIWRAFLDVEGHLVTVSARSFETAPLSADLQRRLLDLSVRSLRGANTSEPDGSSE